MLESYTVKEGVAFAVSTSTVSRHVRSEVASNAAAVAVPPTQASM